MVWPYQENDQVNEMTGHATSDRTVEISSVRLQPRNKNYKLSILTYNALHTGQPYYLADLIDIYEPSRCLRLLSPSCCSFLS